MTTLVDDLQKSRIMVLEKRMETNVSSTPDASILNRI